MLVKFSRDMPTMMSYKYMSRFMKDNSVTISRFVDEELPLLAHTDVKVFFFFLSCVCVYFSYYSDIFKQICRTILTYIILILHVAMLFSVYLICFDVLYSLVLSNIITIINTCVYLTDKFLLKTVFL